MKRVLSLVLALVLVLGMIPTFAADKTGGEQLFDLGLIEGDNGDLMEDQTLERQEFAKLLAQLNDELEQAQDWKTPATYADVDKIESWAKSYVAYAQEREWMTGKDNNMFDPAAELKSQELLTVLLRILGYDDTWEKVFETAAEVGLVAEDIKAITRGDAFELIWTAVNTKMADSDMTLGVHLGVLEPEVPVVTELAVKSVVADNARQVKVEFNQAVDVDTLTATNVKIFRGVSTTAEAFDVALSEDGMVATFGLNANSMAQDSNVKVVMKDVVADADATMKLAEVTQTVVMKDTTSPSVVSATFETSKTIRITLSEPLQLETNPANLHVLQNILIDGNKLVGKVEQNYANNTLLVTLGGKVAVGEHKIKVTGYRDFAGWLAVDAEFTSSVIEDKTAPKVVSVDAGRTTVKVTFDEALSLLGNVKINGVTYTAGATTDNKTYKITLNSNAYLGLASIVQAELEYYGATDMEGNVAATAAAPVKFAFVAKDDTVVPTAIVEIDANNNIIVTFSEEMSDPGKIKIEKTDGTLVVKDLVPALKSATKYQYQVTAANAKLNAVNAITAYNVTLASAKDNSVRENAIVSTVTSVEAKDVVKPSISKALLTEPGSATGTNGTEVAVVNGTASGTGLVETKKAQVTVYFSEAMDVNTIQDKANYLIKIGATEYQGSALSMSAVASADAKSVVFTFDGTINEAKTLYTAGIKATDEIKVLLVKDAAGNTISTDTTLANAVFNEPVVIAAMSSVALALAEADEAAVSDAYGANTVAVIAKNKIKVGFNNPISLLAPSDFTIVETATPTNVYLVGISYELSASGKSAIITLNGDLTTDGKFVDANNAEKAVSLKILKDNLKDSYGTKLAADQTVALVAANDYVKPEIVKIEKHATDKNKAVITFSEPVVSSSLISEMIVKDTNSTVLGFLAGTFTYNVNDATDSDVVTVKLSAPLLAAMADGNNDYYFSVPSGLTITDKATAANKLGPVADIKATLAVDDTAPVAPTVTYQDVDTSTTLTAGDKITLTFTEAVKIATGGVLGDKALDNTFVPLTDAVATSADANGFATVWVITLQAGDLANIGFNGAGLTAVQLQVLNTKITDISLNAPAAAFNIVTSEAF